jgi:hypothetical protein
MRRVVNDLKENEELPKSGRESPDSGFNQLLLGTVPVFQLRAHHPLAVIDYCDWLAI